MMHAMEETPQPAGLDYVFRIAPASNAPPTEKVVYVKGPDGRMVPRYFDEKSPSSEASQRSTERT